MNRIFGLIKKSGGDTSKDLSRVIKTIKENGFELRESISSDSEFLLQFGNNSKIESFHNNGLVIQIDGKIHNIEDLINEFGLNESKHFDVIFTLYKRFRYKIADFLIGDFVLSIFDKEKNDLFIIRDSFGTKPLYYYDNDDCLIYSSEIKFIQCTSGFVNEPNIKRICDFLCQNKSNPRDTFYKNINSLEPSHYLSLSNNRIDIKKYRHFKSYSFKKGGLKQAQKDLHHALTSAYEARFEESTCVLLSGGLDSSIIYSIAERYNKDNTKSISYNFFDKNIPLNCDKSFYQSKVTKHSEKNIKIRFDTKSPYSNVDKWLERYDQPFNLPNAYIFEEMYRVAANHGFQGIYDGVDGDLVCSHGWERFKELFRPLSLGIFIYELLMFKNKHDYTEYTSSNLIRLFLKPLVLENKILNFLVNKYRKYTNQKSPKHEPNKILTSDTLKKIRFNDTYNKINNFRSHKEKMMSPLVEQAFINPNILFFKDNVLQLSPFFDKRVVDLCVSFPSSFKLRHGESRYILRKTFQKFLPKEIIKRFSKSNLSENFIKKINKSDLKNILHEINTIHPLIQELVDIEKLKINYSRIRNRKLDEQTSMNIWNFYLVNKWLKKHFRDL